MKSRRTWAWKDFHLNGKAHLKVFKIRFIFKNRELQSIWCEVLSFWLRGDNRKPVRFPNVLKWVFFSPPKRFSRVSQWFEWGMFLALSSPLSRMNYWRDRTDFLWTYSCFNEAQNFDRESRRIFKEILVFELENQCFGLLMIDVIKTLQAVTITPLPQAPSIEERYGEDLKRLTIQKTKLHCFQ